MSAVVTVIYTIAGAGGGADRENSVPNALDIQVVDREVYLFDVMSNFLVHQVGISYSYYAHINHKGETIHLPTPR
jgi:hypothetical protein